MSAKKDFCLRGHPRMPENLDQGLDCKECRRARQRKRAFERYWADETYRKANWKRKQEQVLRIRRERIAAKAGKPTKTFSEIITEAIREEVTNG